MNERKITPREKSIREMYRYVMRDYTVRVNFSWMPAEFRWYEGCDGRDWISVDFFGSTSCRVNYTAFKTQVRICSQVGTNFKRGAIEFEAFK